MATKTSNVRMSVSGQKSLSGLGKMRASNALMSIQAFQKSNEDVKKRASLKLGIQEEDEESESGATKTDVGQLKIENERLKTTLMILNQKMRNEEDTADLADKWKSQV